MLPTPDELPAQFRPKPMRRKSCFTHFEIRRRSGMSSSQAPVIKDSGTNSTAAQSYVAKMQIANIRPSPGDKKRLLVDNIIEKTEITYVSSIPKKVGKFNARKTEADHYKMISRPARRDQDAGDEEQENEGPFLQVNGIENSQKISLYSLHLRKSFESESSDSLCREEQPIITADSRNHNMKILKFTGNSGCESKDRSKDNMRRNDQEEQMNQIKKLSNINMKKSIKLKIGKNNGKQIKQMLMELKDQQLEMMGMLKKYIQRKQNDEKVNMNTDFPASKSMEKREIRQVCNQIISIGKKEKNNILDIKKKDSVSRNGAPMHDHPSLTRLEQSGQISLSPYFAKFISEVINSNIFVSPPLAIRMGLRELISRRLQFFCLNFNYFLDQIISFDQDEISIDLLKNLFKDTPFRLDDQQIDMIMATVLENSGQCQEIKLADLEKIPISLACQKMRYFIYNRKPLNQFLVEQNLKKLKTIFKPHKTLNFNQKPSSGCNIKQSCMINQNPSCPSIEGQSQKQQTTMSIENLQEMLTSLRLDEIQIQILIGKLCVSSKSVRTLKYDLLFDPNWFDQIPH